MMTVNVHIEVINPPISLCEDELKKEISETVTETLASKISVNGIILPNELNTIVLRYFSGVTTEMLKQKSRKGEIVLARQICMCLLHKYSIYNLKEIGFKYGKRDHITVIHALQSIQDRLDTDKRFIALFNSIETKVKQSINEFSESMPSYRLSAKRYMQTTAEQPKPIGK